MEKKIIIYGSNGEKKIETTEEEQKQILEEIGEDFFDIHKEE
ncbi:hypothetical protein V7124_25055 [Neobacillus niacini]